MRTKTPLILSSFSWLFRISVVIRENTQSAHATWRFVRDHRLKLLELCVASMNIVGFHLTLSFPWQVTRITQACARFDSFLSTILTRCPSDQGLDCFDSGNVAWAYTPSIVSWSVVIWIAGRQVDIVRFDGSGTWLLIRLTATDTILYMYSTISSEASYSEFN